MKDQLTQHLRQFKKSTITLDELEDLWIDHFTTYQDFAEWVLHFEEVGVLSMVKSKGRNTRVPSLAYRYRLDKKPLQQAFHQELKQYRLYFHPSIQLDSYFSLDPSVWEEDLPYLEHLHQYITQYGFPSEEVPAPERSVEIVGDEKWIEEKQGKSLLERLGVWDKLLIIPVSDPIMFAINPHQVQEERQYHLIVENKTTYQGLLDALKDTPFSTLIYGAGKKIIKSIEQFSRQYPVSGATHTFYYFGDLDHEGLSIWHQLYQKEPVLPALPFYRACLEKADMKGKTNHRKSVEAVDAFLSYFSIEEQKRIKDLLEQGGYLAQEVLTTKELQEIWRNSSWD